MLDEHFSDLVAERALLIARQLGWNWDRTERTDETIRITLTIGVPNANSQYMTTIIHRLESILEAMDWHLSAANVSQTSAIVQLEYQAQPPEPRMAPTIQQEQEEKEEQTA
jgi:DNA-binding LacI/PurR family transcriptional regulator